MVFSPEIQKTWVDDEKSEVNPFLFVPEDKKIEEKQLKTIEELQDRLNHEILSHKLTKASYENTAQTRIQVYISTTQKRLETLIAELERKNMELMREKILLNGKIAELKGALDDAVNAKEVFAGEIKNEESKFKNLFQTIKEEGSPVKGQGRRSESSTDISQQVIVLS